MPLQAITKRFDFTEVGASDLWCEFYRVPAMPYQKFVELWVGKPGERFPDDIMQRRLTYHIKAWNIPHPGTGEIMALPKDNPLAFETIQAIFAMRIGEEIQQDHLEAQDDLNLALKNRTE